MRYAMTVILLLSGAHALAQNPNDAAAAALESARATIAQDNCPSATARPAAPPVQLSDNTVREASYHRILIEGCGRSMQRNFLSLVMLDGSRQMMETLPGTTTTDPVLQRDALRAALMAAQAAAPECRQIRPVAAHMDTPDPDAGASRRTQPWTETWIMNACGAMLAVPMLFTPTGQGTTFTARSNVRRLNP